MLHRCVHCDQLFLTSGYGSACNYCGGEQESQLELQVDDGVVEWWLIAVIAMHGEAREVRQRWVIR